MTEVFDHYKTVNVQSGYIDLVSQVFWLPSTQKIG
jgi:hypothetical protein